MRTVILILTVLLLAAMLPAQQPQLAGPVSGVVFDLESRAVRAVMGVPGSAYLGAPLVAGLDFAAVSPDRRLAIVSRGGHLYLINLASPELAETLLAEDAGTPALAAWNDASTAAAVLSGGQLTVWRNLAATPESAVWAAPAGITALALAGDAGAVAAGIPGEETGGVYLVSSSEARLLTRLAQPAALALANGSRDVFVADRARHEILEIRNWRDSAATALFSSAAQGVDDPVAVALSPDGRLVYAASGAGQSVLIFDRLSQAMTAQLALDFTPTRLEPLGDGSYFLLNQRGAAQPLELLKTGLSPSVLFVPAGEVEN